MKKHLIIALLASIICVPAAFAQANSVTTQCANLWRKAKAANQTGKQTWPEYLSACSDKLAKAEKKTSHQAAVEEDESDVAIKKHTKQAQSGTPTPAQKAMYKRMRQCGKMWKADKAAGKTGNKTWPEYWDKCSDRLKAKG